MSHTEKVAGVMMGETGGSRNSPRTLNTPESHLQAPFPTCSHLSSDHPSQAPPITRMPACLPSPGHLASTGPLASWVPLPVRVGEVTSARQK